MEWEYNASRDGFHIPQDAGEYTDGLVAIMMRIPDGWGRWISCDKGWYPIIVDVDRRLSELDPNYVVHQVKEKFGSLCYYFEPTDSVDKETWAKMHQIVAKAADKAAKTCERCGSAEGVELRKRSGGKHSAMNALEYRNLGKGEIIPGGFEAPKSRW